MRKYLHIYHFFLCVEEGSTGMTSPGLQHAGKVGLEAFKIIQSNSGYSGFALKPASYDNSTRIITV